MPTHASSLAREELTVLMVGNGEPLQDGVRQALERRHVNVEHSAIVGCAHAAIASAPDVVLLLGDAAADGGTQVLGRLAASPLAAVVPVVLLADDEGIGDRVQAFRYGATAVIPRSASVDAIANRVFELMDEIPERSGNARGEIGEATLADFTSMLTRELRNGILSVQGAESDAPKIRFVLGEGRAVADAGRGVRCQSEASHSSSRSRQIRVRTTRWGHAAAPRTRLYATTWNPQPRSRECGSFSRMMT